MFGFIFILTFGFQLVELSRSAGCGTPTVQPSSHRIVGGTPAIEGSHPWMVMLKESGIPTCGGSIIASNLILSAAHCFEDQGSDNPAMWGAFVGKHHLYKHDASESYYRVSKIIMHPAYDTNSVANDIALLVLSDPIYFNDRVMPVCLPQNESINYHVGQSCIAAGWGETQGTLPRDVLNQVTVPILSDHLCMRFDWYGRDFIPETTLCAGYAQGIKDSCAGDSGGPLICKYGSSWYQMGITSWGYDCAKPKWPGIYTDVAVYSHWITEQALENRITLI